MICQERYKMLSREKIASREIFNGLNQGELEDIAKLCTEDVFDDGDRMLAEGERADYFFILEEGSMDLRFELPYRKSSKEMTVTTVQPGECFAWSALVRPHNATLSCYSTEKSKVIKIRGADLLALCERNSHIGFVLMQNLAKMIGERLTQQQAVFIREGGDSLRFRW